MLSLKLYFYIQFNRCILFASVYLCINTILARLGRVFAQRRGTENVRSPSSRSWLAVCLSVKKCMQSGDLPDSPCQLCHCIWRSLVLTLGREGVGQRIWQRTTEDDICVPYLSIPYVSICFCHSQSGAWGAPSTKPLDLKNSHKCARKLNVILLSILTINCHELLTELTMWALGDFLCYLEFSYNNILVIK